MKKKDAFIFIILLIIIIAGCLVGQFKGGIIAGAGITILILVSIGKHIAQKSISRIDKSIRDHIVKND